MRNGRNIHLGPTEFRLLKFLMQHPNRIFSREEIIYEIWGADAIMGSPHGGRPRAAFA
jgi:two-component system phosphate regulon response regulator PhoB